MPRLTRARAEQVLKSSFAEWIQELDLRFEAIEPERLRMRLPFHERPVHWGAESTADRPDVGLSFYSSQESNAG